MSNLVVEPVRSRRQRKQFLEFPWTIYRNEPHWFPPILAQQKELLGWSWKRHPFYESAESQSFLAYRNGQVAGRITAILNHEHEKYHHDGRGFFGFFESIDDQAVANALFDAVKAWLAARNIHLMRGPSSPSMNYECGLLIEGFDFDPSFMLVYNPPYYQKLVEGYGFTKAHDLYGYWGHISQILDQSLGKVEHIIQQATERFEIKVRPMNPKNFNEELRTFLRLYNYSLERQWGFIPLTESEIYHFGHSLKMLIEPELALIADVEGKPVGAVLALPDYNPRVKKINGRLWPFGFLTILKKPRPMKTVRIIAINVVPEYRVLGVGLVLLGGLVPKALQVGVEVGDFSWISEVNMTARGGLEKAGAHRNRTWRMYDWGKPSAITGQQSAE